MRSKRLTPRPETDVKLTAVQLGLLSVGAVGYAVAAQGVESLRVPFLVSGIALAAAASTVLPRYLRLRRESGMTPSLVRPFVTFDEMKRTMSDQIQKGYSLLGWGFIWQKSQCQAAKDILSGDWYEGVHQRQVREHQLRWLKTHIGTSLLRPWSAYKTLIALRSCVALEPGYAFLRTLGREEPCYVRTKDLEGHILVIGTTGSGKTQFLCFSIFESVLKGDIVFVMDPKNDMGFRDSIEAMCRNAGRQKDFVCFDLAHPETSVPTDFLANFARPTEVASRIVEAQPTQNGEGAAFVEMGRNVIAALCLGMNIVGERPTMLRLFHYYTNRKPLAVKVLQSFLHVESDEPLPSGDELDAKYDELQSIYRERGQSSADVDQVLFVADLDEDMLMKRTLATYQLLAKLSSEELQKILSPGTNEWETQGFSNTRDFITKKKVVYVGLDALSDSSLARTVGTMLLADLKAVAGARYNFDDVGCSVRLFIDEAAEVCCEPMVQMLNKARGAGFVITVATQTVADFTANMGNQADATRVLANVNNIIALRCNDPETASFVADRMPKTTVATTMVSHDVTMSSEQLSAVGASMGERRTEQETELVPSFLLGVLPSREFFAFVSGGHVFKGRVPLLLPAAKDFRREA